jgi:L-ascorbate metabolism protein UlaG (beta-lactamase superfamily)
MRGYLRRNVKAEPLFNQWYAWSHLVSPVTAAMNVVNAHLKVMRSYVASPQVHAQAAKNPALAGGQFLDLDSGRVDDVRALIASTEASSADLIELAGAVRSLDQLLQTEANGSSLECLYERIPEQLRGFVELTYDLVTGAPRIRFLEELLYRSSYYSTARQSVMLSLTESDERPFVLSTPRLKNPGYVQVSIPFASPELDALFESKREPVDVDDLAARVGVAETDRSLFASFFDETPPRTPERYTGPGVRVRYFGHACVLFETKETSVLTDPAISYSYPTDLGRFTFEDLPPHIDYLLLTHSHQDHVLIETLLQLRDRVGSVLVPRSSGGWLEDPSLRLMFQRLGFRRVQELDELESVEIPGGSVTGIPFFGEHGDLDVRTKLAHLVRFGDWTALLAADSNNVEPRLYERLQGTIGNVDTLFIGMECEGAPHSWVYGPLYTRPLSRKNDQARRLNGSDFARAKQIVDTLGVKRVYVYAMGQEPWYGHIMGLHYSPESRPIVESERLLAYCRERGLVSERLFVKHEFDRSTG